MLDMNKEDKAYKAGKITEIKAIMEANKGNEKAVAAGQITLMEKVVAYLESNNDYEFWSDRMETRMLMTKVGKMLR